MQFSGILSKSIDDPEMNSGNIAGGPNQYIFSPLWWRVSAIRYANVVFPLPLSPRKITRKPFLDCAVEVLNEPKEHLFFAISCYVGIPYNILQKASEQVVLLFEKPNEEGIGYYDEL